MARVIWYSARGTMNLGRNKKKLNKKQQKEQRKAKALLLKDLARIQGGKRYRKELPCF